MPATTSQTRPATAATAWLSRPEWSRKARAIALSGTMPRPTSFATSTTGPGAAASDSSRASRAASTSRPWCIRLPSHTVRQSTSTCVPGTLSRPIVAASSMGASTVRQDSARRARWIAILSAMSSSTSSAVAT